MKKRSWKTRLEMKFHFRFGIAMGAWSRRLRCCFIGIWGLPMIFESKILSVLFCMELE